jgi:hypothetical protein
LIRTETRQANVKKKKKKSIVPWACAVQEGVDSEWQLLKLFIIRCSTLGRVPLAHGSSSEKLI